MYTQLTIVQEGPLTIQFVHGRMSQKTFSGRGVHGIHGVQSSSQVHGVFCQCEAYKKDKKLFPHIGYSLLDVTYSFTRAIKHIFIYCLLFVVQSSIQLQQKETGTNTQVLTFQQSAYLITFLSWRAQLNFVTLRYIRPIYRCLKYVW